jgi:hypothetical protein
MIAWVDEQCRSWGAHKRWLEYGQSGYPPLSILGKLIEEGPGAGSGTFSGTVPVRDDPPSYRAVTLAMRKMADTHEMGTPWAVTHAHYFFAGFAKSKAPKLGLTLRQYWQHLHAAHAFISACDFPHFDREDRDVPRSTEACARNNRAA